MKTIKIFLLIMFLSSCKSSIYSYEEKENFNKTQAQKIVKSNENNKEINKRYSEKVQKEKEKELIELNNKSNIKNNNIKNQTSFKFY